MTIAVYSILVYCCKVILAAGLLFGYYWLALRNRPFHRYNRFFLLFAALLPVIIPLLPLPLDFLPAQQQDNGALVRTLRVITLSEWHDPEGGPAGPAVNSTPSLLPWLAGVVYMAGMLRGLLVFGSSLVSIIRIKRKYRPLRINGVKVYNTMEPGTPYSFFRSVFWNREIDPQSHHGEQIFSHELRHVEQRHSIDTLLLQLLCCVGWFNPFFYLIAGELKVVHEFLADESSVPEKDRLGYAELLVNHALLSRQKNVANVHPFFHNHLKRRIMMITQMNPRNQRLRRFGRILSLPFVLMLAVTFAFRSPGPARSAHLSAGRDGRTLKVVIDAGHGGIDPGAQKYSIVEKDITLSIVRKIKEQAGNYPVEIVLTRNTDELPNKATSIREGLVNRVEIVKREKADLFISIHINNSGGDPTVYPGIEAYISNRRTDQQSEALASILLQQLGKVHATDPTIRKRSLQGVYVLDKTPCPAVLLECGNMDSPADRSFITDPSNYEKIADGILSAIVQYGKGKE